MTTISALIKLTDEIFPYATETPMVSNTKQDSITAGIISEISDNMTTIIISIPVVTSTETISTMEEMETTTKPFEIITLDTIIERTQNQTRGSTTMITTETTGNNISYNSSNVIIHNSISRKCTRR